MHKNNHKNVIYLNSIDQINIKNPDLVIISSTSKGRSNLILKLKKNFIQNIG